MPSARSRPALQVSGGYNEDRFDSLQKQLDQLTSRVDQGFERLEVLLRGYEERTRQIETHEAACAPLLTSKIDAAWRKIEQHSTEIETLRTILTDIAQTNKVLKWLLAIFTAVLSALLIGLVTGQIQLLAR